MGYEIILCPYDLGASIRQANERARQREIVKNAPAKPVLPPLSQEELDQIINDPNLLDGLNNPNNLPIY